MITFSSSKLLSHPDKLLKDHLQQTVNTIDQIVTSKEISKKLGDLARIIGVCHDFGKMTSFFQDYIRDTNNSELDKPIKNHARISAAFTYYTIQENLNLEDPLYPIIGWYVVLKHHLNLEDLSRDKIESEWEEGNNYEIMKKQADDLKDNLEDIRELYERFDFSVDLEKFLEEMVSKENEIFQDIKKAAFKLEIKIEDMDYFMDTLFLYSLLQDADKFSSAEVQYPQRKELPSYSIVDKYIKDVIQPEENEINKLRDCASSEILEKINRTNISSNRIFSLTLPTGLGKTLSAFKAGLRLRERIKNEFQIKPRLIYSLPFLSIIEQNYDSLKNVLDFEFDETPPEILLKHHYLSKGFSKGGEENPISDLLLTESWHSEIVVTTFVQLFESMITNKKNRARKFHNITNSIIILDEIQSIPRKYWVLVNNYLKKLTNKYNCWIIFMTATQPLIFEPDEITELIEEKEKYFSNMDRVRYADKREISVVDALKSKIVEAYEETDKSVMAVMNTIGSAEKLFKKIQEEFNDKDKLVFLSTKLLPRDRLKKIEKIKGEEGQKVIVTTQLIEAGVDIDLDIIYRDFAPFDSIVQAGGRCNRENQDEKGKVEVIELINEQDGEKKYNQYIYDSVLLDCTSEGMDELSSFSERNFSFEGVREYYKKLKNRGADKESKEILKSIKNLKFSKAREFRLIKKDYDEISVYIENDEKAIKIRKDIIDILEENWGYEKKGKLLSKRKEFYNNIIDLRVDEELEEKIAALPQVGSIEDLYLVRKDDKNRWYDEDIGFKPPENTFEDRFT